LILSIISFIILYPFSEEELPPMKEVPFTSLLGLEESPTFSPDGSQIAFSWQSFREGDIPVENIYVKLVGAGSEQPLVVNKSGSDALPSWSPDGRYIAFARISQDESGIYIIPARGGPEKKLAEVNYGQTVWFTNLSWSPDSKSIAYSAMDSVKDFSRIYLLSIDTRQVQKLTDAPDEDLNDYYCAISPDGQKLAVARGAQSSYDIYIVPMKGGEAERLTFNNMWIWGLTWTTDGAEIVFSSYSGGKSSLWRISATGGEPRRVPVSEGSLVNPIVAKQGNRLAVVQYSDDENIWRVEIPKPKGRKTTPSKLIYSTLWEGHAKYSPDGKKIAYSSGRSGSAQIWICDSTGQNSEQLTNLNGNAQAGSPRWSPDGEMITYVGNIEGQNEIFIISVEGGPPVQITKNSAKEYRPSFSRDCNWIYFSSDRSGVWQIWKISAQGGTAIQVTNKGGYIARESTDGKWIYFTKYDTTGIWKKSLHEGGETLVLNSNNEQNQWDLVEDGIYFIKGKVKSSVINFYDFANGKITEIADLGIRWSFDLDVSSDQHWILYTQAVEESDIVLVENFR
jgi:Tol biopolymer transport system component